MALGAAAAAKEVPYLFRTFETVLLELFLYFHFSSSRKSRWKDHLTEVQSYELCVFFWNDNFVNLQPSIVHACVCCCFGMQCGE